MNYAYMQLCTFCILSCLALGCPGSHFVMNHAFMYVELGLFLLDIGIFFKLYSALYSETD